MAAKSSRYVAFLRAVNVGGRMAKMTELKRLFEKLTVARRVTRSRARILATGCRRWMRSKGRASPLNVKRPRFP